MQIIVEARAEYERIVAEMRIATALRHNIPQAADRVLNTGDKVLVSRKGEPEWNGPHKVVNFTP